MTERMPLPSSRGRGRPLGSTKKKAEKTPAVPRRPLDEGAPPGGWLPPGTTFRTPPGGMLAGSAPGEGSVPFTAEAQAEIAGGKEEPADEPDQDIIEWARASIAEICETFGDDLLHILETVGERRPVVSPTLIGRKTCLDCEHAIISTGMCGKFGAVPPMKVIANAKEMCPDFSEEEIPL